MCPRRQQIRQVGCAAPVLPAKWCPQRQQKVEAAHALDWGVLVGCAAPVLPAIVDKMVFPEITEG